ncbi:FecR domain-containing protein [Mariniphaga sp.]|uniref:FecR domain-containing protein n=1 Tax=Mariniphaga sp. TaxID=1954475 RepID=UPI003562F2E0
MKDYHIEELIPSWFEGTLNPEEREKVEQWKAASEENRQIFADSLRAWEGIEQLRRMKKYDPEKAIQQVNGKIEKQKKIRLFDIFQKVAAILILPLIVATLWFALEKPQKTPEPFIAWHTLEIPAGMRSEFYLPDSTKVYLNSKTSLSYPLVFNNSIRQVRLSGEAYFEVAENKEVPFIVNTGRINIEVTGTEFIATRYPHEELTEIVLVEGGINLFQGDYHTTKKDIIQLKPGEKAICMESENKLAVDKVNTAKYKAWKEGLLVFRDDPMPDVVRRLNRWFNVDIQLEGPELKGWAYTATFEDESLEQALELLKISAPIEYTIKRREMKTDKTFSKMEIVIKQK